jgi:hypothetical protein
MMKTAMFEYIFINGKGSMGREVGKREHNKGAKGKEMELEGPRRRREILGGYKV